MAQTDPLVSALLKSRQAQGGADLLHQQLASLLAKPAEMAQHTTPGGAIGEGIGYALDRVGNSLANASVAGAQREAAQSHQAAREAAMTPLPEVKGQEVPADGSLWEATPEETAMAQARALRSQQDATGANQAAIRQRALALAGSGDPAMKAQAEAMLSDYEKSLERLRQAAEFKYRQEHDAASLAEQKRYHDVTDAQNQNNFQAMLGRTGFTQDLETKKYLLLLQKELADRAKAGQGKDLPASVVEGLADLPTALNTIGDLEAEFKRLGMGGLRGKVNAAATNALDLQGTDAADYAGSALVAMQGVGKILEGGKLSNRDEDKYRRMLPRPGDSDEVVKTKVRNAQDFLRGLVKNRLTSLKAAGYNVPDTMLQQSGGQAPSAATKYAINPATGKFEPVK